MITQYDNILIPIHPSFDLEKAAEWAIDHAKPWGTTIHLVQLRRTWSLLDNTQPKFPFERAHQEDLDRYLKVLLFLIHWKNRIERAASGISVRIQYKNSFSLQSLMIKTAQRERPGLIILVFNPGKYRLLIGGPISPSRLTQRSGSTVLSIRTRIKAGVAEERETLFTPSIYSGNWERPSDRTGKTYKNPHYLWSAN